MKKIAIFAIISSVVILSGCINDDYSIEKRYYSIQKTAAYIFKNPEVAPKKELDRSVNALNNFIQKYPENKLALEAEFTIGRLFIVKKEYEMARAYLNNMLNKHSSSEPICSEILFLKGNSYEIEDRWGAANSVYQKIIQQYPLTLRGLSTPIYVAQHYKIKYAPDLMAAAYQEAIAHYKTLINNSSDDKLSFMLNQVIAQSYAELKDWQGVANTFHSMLIRYKNKAGIEVVMLNLAEIYKLKLNNKAKALEMLQTLIQEYPKSKYVKPAKEMITLLSKEK